MKPEDVTALVRAAGSGVRLGQGPKAWVPLAGRSLIDRAVDPLVGRAGRIVVAVPAADLEGARTRISDPTVELIAGGASRWDTTRLLAATSTSTWVVLHDAVHPLVSRRVLEDLLAAAEVSGAAAPALPIEEFTWEASGSTIRKPRQVHIIQTPVVLRTQALRAAVDLITGRPDAVDAEASIVELLAILSLPWTFVRGDPRNIKITYAEDLALAEALVAAGALGGTGAESGS